MTTELAPAPVKERIDVPAVAAALITVTLWGSAFVGIRSAGHAFSPGSIALGRLLVSLVALGGAALVRRKPLPGRVDLGWIAVYGMLWLGVYSVSLNAAERRVDAGTAAMLVNVSPILIAILAGIVLKEGFPHWLFAGCAVAFAGCLMIGFATTDSGSSQAGLGIALLLLAAVSYSVAVVIQKPVLVRVPALEATFLACLAGTAVCLPFAGQLADQLGDASASSIGWVVYLGLGPTALGFATWAFALNRMSAGRLGSVTYLAPVVAIVLGWAILSETPPALAVIGGGLCLVGVAIARRR
jgi:drug/metabolite transporter (DMT)-like permease